MALHSHIETTVTDSSVSVQPRCGGKTRLGKTMWGTTRANMANAVRGVSQGFRKDLELHGVGFKAHVAKDANGLDVVTMRLGMPQYVELGAVLFDLHVCPPSPVVLLSG